MAGVMDPVRARRSRSEGKAGPLCHVVLAEGGWDAGLDEPARGGRDIATRVPLGEAMRLARDAQAEALRQGWRGEVVVTDTEGRRIDAGLN